MIINILLGVIGFILFMCGFAVALTSAFSWTMSLKKTYCFILIGFVMMGMSGFVFSLIPNYTEDFCESHNGEYDFNDGLSLCSIPDAQGNYEVYKILNIKDSFKLASFADEPYKALRFSDGSRT